MDRSCNKRPTNSNGIVCSRSITNTTECSPPSCHPRKPGAYFFVPKDLELGPCIFMIIPIALNGKWGHHLREVRKKVLKIEEYFQSRSNSGKKRHLNLVKFQEGVAAPWSCLWNRMHKKDSREAGYIRNFLPGCKIHKTLRDVYSSLAFCLTLFESIYICKTAPYLYRLHSYPSHTLISLSWQICGFNAQLRLPVLRIADFPASTVTVVF